MRPILTIKKKPAQPPALLSPPPDPPKKPSQPSADDLRKQAELEKRTEHIRLAQEKSRRAKQHTQAIRPLVMAYLESSSVLRDTVWVDGVECFKPLALETRKTVCAAVRAMPQCPSGASNTAIAKLLNERLDAHVKQTAYLNGLVRLQRRYDLDGVAIGAVSQAHQDDAARALLAAVETTKINQPVCE